MKFETFTLEDLTIEDEASFRHVALYADLKEVLRRDRYTFRVLPPSQTGRWDRAVCLNLTFWGSDVGGDILVDRRIQADVVAHVAWHSLALRALAPQGQPGTVDARPSADSLFMGEAIASAFDVYLVGRLLGHAPRSSFLETQVPAMADAASEAGASDEDFEALLSAIAEDPEGAFDDLRALLYDTSRALVTAMSAEEALAVLSHADTHRFGSLLHRYELSNWVLYARAYGSLANRPDDAQRVTSVDGALRGGGGLEWLTRHWLRA